MEKQKNKLPFNINEVEEEPLEEERVRKGKKPKTSEPYTTQLAHLIDMREAISALQKYIRRSETEKALTMAFLLVDQVPYYLFRRLTTIASEDIGNANPQAAILASAIYQSWMNNRERQPKFRGRVLIAQLVIYLCRSPKSREADSATIYTGLKIENGEPIVLDDYVFDVHTKRGRQQGRGMKHFIEEAARLVGETGKDEYRQKMIAYLKKVGKYK